MSDLITVEEAQRLVLERAKPLDAERVPDRAGFRARAGRARGGDRATCRRFRARRWTDSRFAPRTRPRLPCSSRSSGRIAAGSPATTPLGAGEAMAISTGGVVPDGADAVVPVELVGEVDGRVEVRAAIAAGTNVRSRGGDVAAGRVVLEPGARLGAAQVGALAAAGVSEVRCAKRPRVGILVTGSELRKPGEPLGPGEIYESNGLMLAAQLAAAGAVPAQLGVVADDDDVHRKAMEKALLGFDMLVTTGGASVGPHDLVRQVQSELRVEEVFWGVAMKPGRPVAFGVRRDHLVFNLPGNPVSALVCFEVLVRPAVNALLGTVGRRCRAFARGLARRCARAGTPSATSSYGHGASSAARESVLRPLAGQESHMIVSAAQADALVLVPAARRLRGAVRSWPGPIVGRFLGPRCSPRPPSARSTGRTVATDPESESRPPGRHGAHGRRARALRETGRPAAQPTEKSEHEIPGCVPTAKRVATYQGASNRAERCEGARSRAREPEHVEREPGERMRIAHVRNPEPRVQGREGRRAASTG